MTGVTAIALCTSCSRAKNILKELKYATHYISIFTYVCDVLIKSFYEMTYSVLFACNEIRKRHFIDKINDKTSKTMKNANCDVNVEAKVKMKNFLHVGYMTST